MTNRKRPSLDDVCVLVGKEITVGELHEQIESDGKQTEVFCSRFDLYANDFYSSAMQDLKVSMILILDSESYSGEKEVIYDNQHYTIIRTYHREDGLLEVSCSEG